MTVGSVSVMLIDERVCFDRSFIRYCLQKTKIK